MEISGSPLLLSGRKIVFIEHLLSGSHWSRYCVFVNPLTSVCNPWQRVMTNLDSILKSRDTLPTKVHIVEAMVSPLELDHGKGWAQKNWCFWTVVLEKTLESPLDCKDIKPVNPKGNQLWIFIGRTDAEAEAPVLWPLMPRTDLREKTLMLGKIEDKRERRVAEDEMVR